MKDIRIFVASSKELEKERNYLAFLVLSKTEEFEKRGFRVRLSKWEYVDPKMTAARTEDRYLDEMYNCDAALVLFRDIAGMYTREELDKAISCEQSRYTRLKTHRILFAADGESDSDAVKLRNSLPEGSYGIWDGMEELRAEFLSLIDRLALFDNLIHTPTDAHVRNISAFLAADEELADDRNAFADTVLNVNDLLEHAHRNIRIRLKFYEPENAESVIESSEMGLVLYGTNYQMFGIDEIERVYERIKDERQNPKRFYVFFRDLDQEVEKSLDKAFKTFRSDFVSKMGHFTCQFGDANALRLSFLLSLERYAGESVELYSTVSAPTAPVFVGREEELRKLCALLEPVPGLFPAGRLPVITGAGGTGKSELVRQYASQLRIQYPGGVFQVDMEHRKTWDEVFLGILDGTPNNGVNVKEFLKLDVKGDSCEEQSEAITSVTVRDALLRKARETGPILLVLDNVEGCMQLLGRDGGFQKAFPTGFSERVRVNVIATARVCDVMLRDTDWAVPFPLGDLSRDAALEILLADRSEVDADERKAAERVAELLGYRALYLRRVPALIGDLYAQTICDSYVELAKALEENLLETVAEETEEAHLPDVLWKMTCERLAKIPLGAECIKLAQVASFFSPDGFPKHILKYLWKTVVAPGQDERKFDRAFAILQHHNVFQSDDPVRVHRLDRAAILQTAKSESGIEENIGKFLAEYFGMTHEIWLTLSDFPATISHLPNDVNNGGVWAELLCLNPNLSSICPWEKLNGKNWLQVLENRPEFSDKCQWNKLGNYDWGELLCVQPQFATRCPWDWKEQTSYELSLILSKQPQFVDKCNLDDLEGPDWCRLLSEQPCLANICPWEKLGGWDWSRLLSRQPQLANKIDWDNVEEGFQWDDLLAEQPQFAGKCPWEELNDFNWCRLLSKQPQFADRCPRDVWDTFAGDEWCFLLSAQPCFANICSWDKLSGEDWSNLLSEQPQFADRCPWEMLDGDDWSKLLSVQPQFADRCPWEMLDGNDWSLLLSEQTQFSDRCFWEKLRGAAWCWLLRNQPQFADKCDWEKLGGAAWCRLLAEQPQFADKCDWDKLDGDKWGYLLMDQPQFADKCDWKKLDSDVWCKLLKKHPQFANKCDWNIFNGYDWGEILIAQPQLADKCLWDRLSPFDWWRLLNAMPQFADKCPYGHNELARALGESCSSFFGEELFAD